MNFEGIVLPHEKSWSTHFNLSQDILLDDVIDTSLLGPLKLFLCHSGKNIRPRLVELGFRLGMEEEDEFTVNHHGRKLERAASIIEAIHSGSLIIDDIQDESTVRRNAPTFHLQHGLPKALNAGNWLYFWALEQIQNLELDSSQVPSLLFDLLKLMTRAHYGQALDVGVPIHTVKQERVKGICLASMELKTGTLFAMAFRLGLSLHPSHEKHQKLLELATKLGVALQAYDDVGNFLAEKVSGPSKRHEDLKHKRPTWIWAQASLLPPEIYQAFLEATDALPQENKLNTWIIQNHFHQKLQESAGHFLSEAIKEFHESFQETHPVATQMILDIKHQLEKAYVRA